MLIGNKISKYGDNNVLIYQMGKVGSSALAAAISDSLQIHDFYNNPPSKQRKKILCYTFMDRFKDFLFRLVKLALVKSRKELKIITVIRDPFERNISMYFQSLIYYMADHQVGFCTGGKGVGGLGEGNDILIDCFEKKFNHEYAINWLDDELKRLTGIDVYEHEFDREKGFMEVNSGKCSLFLCELSKMPTLTEELGKFVGSPVELAKTNRSTNKWYSGAYEWFLNNYDYKKSEHYDTIVNSKYYKKFYR